MITRVKTTIFQRDVIRYGSFILLILLAGVLLLMSGVARYPEMLGMAYLSFTFGLRHAFDVDHIAAIDAEGEGQMYFDDQDGGFQPCR